MQQPASDYVRAAVTAAVDIHKADLPGDILIFLTGQVRGHTPQGCADAATGCVNASQHVHMHRLPAVDWFRAFCRALCKAFRSCCRACWSMRDLQMGALVEILGGLLCALKLRSAPSTHS